MSMKDMRDFLIKQMAELADSDRQGDELAATIDRAKASSLVASTYIQAVRTEIDAIRVLDETGRLPVAVEAPPVQRHGAVLSFDGGKEAA